MRGVSRHMEITFRLDDDDYRDFVKHARARRREWRHSLETRPVRVGVLDLPRANGDSHLVLLGGEPGGISRALVRRPWVYGLLDCDLVLVLAPL